MSRGDYDGHHARISSDDVYDNSHRAFLQAFMSQSTMTVDEMKPLVAAIMTITEPDRERLPDDITQQVITSMVQTINSRIAPLDYEIRSTRDQQDRTLIYSLVNTTSDAFTQLATTYTADEIAYIKRLLDAMFEENSTRVRETMAVKQMRALQLAKAPARNRQSGVGAEDSQQVESQAKTISQTDADRILSKLVLEGFFHKSRGRYYSLAPRALMELRSYLKETYNDIPAEGDEDADVTIRIRDCEGCTEIVTIGLRCNNKNCEVRWHEGCANQFFTRQQGGDPKCPKCKRDWTGDSYVGEKADRVQSRNRASGQRSSLVEMDDDDDNDEDDD